MTASPKVHRYAYAYGDDTHDPWPGDITEHLSWWCRYRFTGWCWIAIPRTTSAEKTGTDNDEETQP